LSRHRKIPAHRSRALALIAAGALTVATAATAAAATWPSGTTAGHPRDAAGSLLTVTGQPLQMQAFEQRTASQSLQSDQIRDPAAGLAADGQAARPPAARKVPPARAITAASQPASQPAAHSISGAQPTQAATAAPGSPQQIAEAMLASFGWSFSQFSCLNPLWAH